MKLYELSQEIAELYRKIRHGVVRVRQLDEAGEVIAEASGTLWTQAGIIVTVSHPFDDPERIVVIHGDDAPVTATARGWDNRYDLAVLEVEGTSLSAWTDWTELETVNPGELVFSLGYGEIRPGMVSRMVPEAVNRWGGVLKPRVEVDGTLGPTQAGGPLVNSAGRFVGVNSPAPDCGGQTVSYGQLQNLVQELLLRGNPQPAYLGVRTAPAQTADGRRGVVVTQVDAGSPAEAAGICTGDVLLTAAGRQLVHPHRLFLLLRTMKAGDALELRVRRTGAEQTLSATLAGIGPNHEG